MIDPDRAVPVRYGPGVHCSHGSVESLEAPGTKIPVVFVDVLPPAHEVAAGDEVMPELTLCWPIDFAREVGGWLISEAARGEVCKGDDHEH